MDCLLRTTTAPRDPNGAANDPFPATTGLGFARFLFPLLQPMLGMVGQPAIRQ